MHVGQARGVEQRLAPSLCSTPSTPGERLTRTSDLADAQSTTSSSSATIKARPLPVASPRRSAIDGLWHLVSQPPRRSPSVGRDCDLVSAEVVARSERDCDLASLSGDRHLSEIAPPSRPKRCRPRRRRLDVKPLPVMNPSLVAAPSAPPTQPDPAVARPPWWQRCPRAPHLCRRRRAQTSSSSRPVSDRVEVGRGRRRSRRAGLAQGLASTRQAMGRQAVRSRPSGRRRAAAVLEPAPSPPSLAVSAPRTPPHGRRPRGHSRRTRSTQAPCCCRGRRSTLRACGSREPRSIEACRSRGRGCHRSCERSRPRRARQGAL